MGSKSAKSLIRDEGYRKNGAVGHGWGRKVRRIQCVGDRSVGSGTSSGLDLLDQARGGGRSVGSGTSSGKLCWIGDEFGADLLVRGQVQGGSVGSGTS